MQLCEFFWFYLQSGSLMTLQCITRFYVKPLDLVAQFLLQIKHIYPILKMR